MSEGYIKNGKYIKTSGSMLQGFKPYKLYGGRHLTDVLGVDTDAEVMTWLDTNKTDTAAWLNAGIMVGDYFTINIEGYASNNVVLAHYLEKVNQLSSEPCIICTFEKELAYKFKWYNDTIPDNPAYLSSDLAATVNSVGDALQMGGVPLTGFTLTEGSTTKSNIKLACLTEMMTFGRNVYADLNTSTSIDNMYSLNNRLPFQLDYFRLCPENLRINLPYHLANFCKKITGTKAGATVTAAGIPGVASMKQELAIRPFFII